MKFKSSHLLKFAILNILLVFGLLMTSCGKPKEEPVAYKPNIYIYPPIKSDIEVKITFPLGGEILKSIPNYDGKWKVNIEPSGIIDKKYSYLFYESSQANVWQKETGYCISKDSLKAFFESNMNEYKFNEKEIKDFTSYWLPKFKKSKFYIIYPQEKEIVDKAIKLEISNKPGQIQRLHYLIEEAQEFNEITKHVIRSKFERKGFYVCEWGVLL